MTGHVFVIQGDTRHLACDAYLYAADKALRPGHGWTQAAPGTAERLNPSVRKAYMAEERFTLPLTERPGHPNEPAPILTAVPYDGVSHEHEFAPRVREFFEVGTEIARRRGITATQSKRERPLLAVPLFGVGGGGAGPFRGKVFRMVYDESLRAAAEHDIDVAVALRDAKDYALAQMIRRERDDAWPELSDELKVQVNRLGGIAQDARLVPFMGAGVSMSAGSPSWDGLIARLADAAGISADVITALKGHDVLDQAAFVRHEFERRFRDDRTPFAQAVIDAVGVERYGIAPPLLAALDAEQAITLNYDRLFEIAADDAQRPRRVIPSPSNSEERWLLKLHGSVDDPSSIVLTREDYLGFNADRAALSSLVTATLMTRHLLFVGFGVKDPHFHEIVHDVRRAVPDKGQPFGTVLTLNDDLVTRSLWDRDLDFVLLPNARVLEIFLDAVLARGASSQSYLLADGYLSTLSAADQAVARALLSMVDAVPAEAREGSAWSPIAGMLERFGWERAGR